MPKRIYVNRLINNSFFCQLCEKIVLNLPAYENTKLILKRIPDFFRPDAPSVLGI